MEGRDCSIECHQHCNHQGGGGTQSTTEICQNGRRANADDHIACRPDAIILMAPQYHIDKVVPAGTTITDKLIHPVRLCHFTDENDAPNIASPCKGNHPEKRGEKRMSPSQGFGDVLSHLSQPQDYANIVISVLNMIM